MIAEQAVTSLQLFLLVFAWLLAVPATLLICLHVALWVISWWQKQVWYGCCRKCGCTDNDCTECVLATGEPCWWIDECHTLCSRCVDDLAPHDLDDLTPDCSPLNARQVTSDKGRVTRRGSP